MFNLFDWYPLATELHAISSINDMYSLIPAVSNYTLYVSIHHFHSVMIGAVILHVCIAWMVTMKFLYVHVGIEIF